MRFYKQYDVAFFLTEDTLKAIHTLLSAQYPDMRIEIGCKDHITRDMLSIENLMNYTNTHAKQIESISFIHDAQCHVRLGKGFLEKDQWNVSVSLHGDEDMIIAISSKISDIVKTSKKWWAFLTKLANDHIAWAGLFVLFFVLMWLSSSERAIRSDTSNFSSGMITLVVLATIWLFVFTKQWVFPNSVFCIGQQKRKQKALDVFRDGAGLLIVLALGAWAISGLLR